MDVLTEGFQIHIRLLVAQGALYELKVVPLTRITRIVTSVERVMARRRA
jgi:hypothetical protein